MNEEFNKLPFAAMIFMCAICISHALLYFPALPETVASQFGADGKPNTWMGKTEFVGLYIGVVVAVTLLFAGLAYAMPRLPDSMINLPNKAYWLAPNRRAAAFEYFTSLFMWFGSATLVFLFDIFHQVFQVHIGAAQTLTHVWWSTGLFLIFTLLWGLWLFYRFNHTDA